MAYKLKPDQEAYRVMDGPMSGKKYDGGGIYTEIPQGHEDRFDLIPDTIPPEPAPEPPALKTKKEQARKVLEETRPSKLKQELDRLKIKYPATADKQVLVDLLMDNTFPAMVPAPREKEGDKTT